MVEVRVPATSANLGPGFDALGIALSLYNTFHFQREEVALEGEADTLIHQAFRRVYQSLGKEAPPVRVSVAAEIPAARGLGSSAACIVGGILGANRFLGDPLSQGELLALATELEGHPDNVAPALLGGLQASVVEEGVVRHGRLPLKKAYDFLALIPDFTLSTAEARRVLPKRLEFQQATANIARVSLLLTGFATGADALIRQGMKDVLHEPYRASLIPGFEALRGTAYAAGALGCYLSGAGPTVMVLTGEGDQRVQAAIRAYLEERHPLWQALVLQEDTRGAQVGSPGDSM